MKKAYLVDFCVTTRVVVEGSSLAHDHVDDDVVTEAIKLAKEKILQTPHLYLIDDNCTNVTEDTDVPYDPVRMIYEEY